MFTLELVSLSGVKFGEEVYEVVVPTPDGYIGIVPHHMPLVSLVAPGIVSIKKNPNTLDRDIEHFAINGGIIEIDEHRIRILVDEADHGSELTEKEVAEALERAKEIATQSRDKVSLDKANQQIQTAQARLRLAELKRRRK